MAKKTNKNSSLDSVKDVAYLTCSMVALILVSSIFFMPSQSPMIVQHSAAPTAQDAPLVKQQNTPKLYDGIVYTYVVNGHRFVNTGDRIPDTS